MADEGCDRVKRSPSHGLAGEDAEPGLDHVDPGGVLRGVVEVDVGVGCQPILDSGRGMGREVVRNNVEFSAAETSSRPDRSPRQTRRQPLNGAAPEQKAGSYLAIRFAAAIAAGTPDFSRIALTFARAAFGSGRTAAM
jgi:hypothetical protein